MQIHDIIVRLDGFTDLREEVATLRTIRDRLEAFTTDYEEWCDNLDDHSRRVYGESAVELVLALADEIEEG